MSEWKEYKLGDIANIQTGPFGSQLHKSDYKSTGIPCIMPCNITANLDICCSNIAYISEEDADRLCKHKTQKGDIIYSRRGDIEKCAYISEKESGWVCGTGCLKVCINSEKANSKFIAYQLSTPLLKSWIVGNAVGTTMLNLNTSILSECPISLPSLPTQQRIASILSSLDDKIEVNRRINEQLEELAQALFKSWFVDFEPFKDGDFVESELGMIPEGWKVGTFSEIVQSTLGGDWGKEIEQGNYAKKVFCIRGADIPEIKSGNRGKMPIRFILDKNFQKKALETNDLVVEISGGSPTQSTGRICRVTNDLLEKYDNSLICTNFCRAIKPKGEYSSYIYYLWQYLYDIGRMFNYENGTTGIKNLMINDIIEKEVIVIPSVIVAEEFANVIRTISTKIQKNGEETEKLTALRDTLLPKLMSGEIDVNERGIERT